MGKNWPTQITCGDKNPFTILKDYLNAASIFANDFYPLTVIVVNNNGPQMLVDDI